MSTPRRYRFGSGEDAFDIYGVPANMGTRFGPLPDPEDLDLSVVTVSVEGHGRRRYPGGPVASVNGHSRERIRQQGIGGTNATPGKPFWIETLTAPGSRTVTDSLQFTTTGTMRQVLDLCLDNLAENQQFRTTGGRTFPGDASV
jgi:hypothetical protein